MNVHRIRCDGCNREVEVPSWTGRPWAPDGWYIVEGVYGGGEPYDQYHLCSLDCHITWANRQRIRGGELLPIGVLT